MPRDAPELGVLPWQSSGGFGEGWGVLGSWHRDGAPSQAAFTACHCGFTLCWVKAGACGVNPLHCRKKQSEPSLRAAAQRIPAGTGRVAAVLSLRRFGVPRLLELGLPCLLSSFCCLCSHTAVGRAEWGFCSQTGRDLPGISDLWVLGSCSASWQPRGRGRAGEPCGVFDKPCTVSGAARGSDSFLNAQ